MIRLSKLFFTAILASLLLSTVLPAQIVVLQYRSVPQENIEEFLHRETTYWAQVAQKVVDDGKLVLWELWQRFGGMDWSKEWRPPNSFSFSEGYWIFGECQTLS